MLVPIPIKEGTMDFNALIMILTVLSSIWVYFDARRIGARRGLIPGLGNLGPGGWFFACLLLWLLAFPFYLAKRPAIKQAAGTGR